MLSLSTKIEQLKKVGPSYLKRLDQLKIKTIRDLFFHFPHRYDDFSQIIPISHLQLGQKATIQGKILKIKTSQTWQRRMNLTEAIVEDKTGTIRVVWFNQPYLVQTLSQEKTVNLAGKVTFAGQTLCLSNPAYEIIKKGETTHTGRLIPIYHETAGLSSRYLRYLIKSILPLTKQITDFLPEQIRKELTLMNLSQALHQIQAPP